MLWSQVISLQMQPTPFNKQYYTTRAGVLVLGTCTRSTRVLNFWYSYFTRTREIQSNSTRTCTRTHGQVLRFSYEYWHEYWYPMLHLRWNYENPHTCGVNSLTYLKGKFQIDLFCYDLDIWHVGCDCWLMCANVYFRLKKRHYYPYISWYCANFAFCFWTGNKL